jgi:hypothetical protein
MHYFFESFGITIAGHLPSAFPDAALNQPKAGVCQLEESWRICHTGKPHWVNLEPRTPKNSSTKLFHE